MKLKILVCSFIFISHFANADSTPEVYGAATQAAIDAARAAETAPNDSLKDEKSVGIGGGAKQINQDDMQEAYIQKIADEYAKCIPDDPKFIQRCEMGKVIASIAEKYKLMSPYLKLLNIDNDTFAKYITARGIGSNRYCNLKALAQLAPNQVDLDKVLSGSIEPMAGCMTTQYRQIESDNEDLYQILKFNTSKLQK